MYTAARGGVGRWGAPWAKAIHTRPPFFPLDARFACTIHFPWGRAPRRSRTARPLARTTACESPSSGRAPFWPSLLSGTGFPLLCICPRVFPFSAVRVQHPPAHRSPHRAAAGADPAVLYSISKNKKSCVLCGNTGNYLYSDIGVVSFSPGGPNPRTTPSDTLPSPPWEVASARVLEPPPSDCRLAARLLFRLLGGCAFLGDPIIHHDRASRCDVVRGVPLRWQRDDGMALL